MENPKQLLFGPSGIPHSTQKPTTANGIRRVKELGLDSMELAFVRAVNISSEKVPEILSVTKETGTWLTCHGQYYVNLNSQGPILAASKKRIQDAMTRCNEL